MPPKKKLVLSRIDRYPFPSLSLPTSLHSFFFLYLPIQNQHLHHFIRQPHPVDPPPHFNIHQVGNPRSLDIVCPSLISNIEELACSMCRPTKYRFRSPLSLSLFSLSPPSLSFFRSLSLFLPNPILSPVQSNPDQTKKPTAILLLFLCSLNCGDLEGEKGIIVEWDEYSGKNKSEYVLRKMRARREGVAGKKVGWLAYVHVSRMFSLFDKEPRNIDMDEWDRWMDAGWSHLVKVTTGLSIDRCWTHTHTTHPSLSLSLCYPIFLSYPASRTLHHMAYSTTPLGYMVCALGRGSIEPHLVPAPIHSLHIIIIAFSSSSSFPKDVHI